MLTLLIALALAAPTDVHHQGRLLNAAGTPIDGSQSVTFTLFDAATDGANLWEQTLSIDLDHGYFSVQLGLDPTDFNGSARWLETRIGSTVLGPRQAIGSVPYALALSAPSSLPSGTTLNGADIATGAHYTDSNVVDGPLSLHSATTLNGAAIATGAHYSDSNVVDGPLSLHAATTLDGAALAVETPQGALCNGNFCTYTFSTTSPSSDHPTCANPGKNIKIGTLSGTNSGNVSTIRITASGSHRGIGGSSYWCHRDVLLTVGDALFSNSLLAGGSASRCGYAGIDAAGYAVSHPNFSGGDVYWHIPLNCGSRQAVDFTVQYNPTYFALTAQP